MILGSPGYVLEKQTQAGLFLRWSRSGGEEGYGLYHKSGPKRNTILGYSVVLDQFFFVVDSKAGSW